MGRQRRVRGRQAFGRQARGAGEFVAGGVVAVDHRGSRRCRSRSAAASSRRPRTCRSAVVWKSLQRCTSLSCTAWTTIGSSISGGACRRCFERRDELRRRAGPADVQVRLVRGAVAGAGQQLRAEEVDRPVPPPRRRRRRGRPRRSLPGPDDRVPAAVGSPAGVQASSLLGAAAADRDQRQGRRRRSPVDVGLVDVGAVVGVGRRRACPRS